MMFERGLTGLAIVIPAYKGKFLSRTLESIAAQTDQRFRVYIGDDASPEPLEGIIKRCSFKPEQLIYHRFESNLGKECLVRHWERCIKLTTEPWIWLFSDDDMMEPSCVASFYQALEESCGKHDLYRFDTVVIDENDKVISLNPPHPDFESWYNFVFFLLSNWRLANQQELVFRRSSFQEMGGFPNFPLAWWSDVAFAIACSTRSEIGKIKGARLLMRKSKGNISSIRSKKIYRLKLKALADFMEWLIKHIEHHDCGNFPGRERIRALARIHFFSRLKTRNAWIGFSDVRMLIPRIKKTFDISPAEGIARLIFLNLLFLIEKLPRLWIR